MESLKLNEELENFLANLDFPYCEVHPKLHTEFICLDFDCPNFKTPFCSLCFKKLHYEAKHSQVEIRSLLTYLLQNQEKILNKADILKTIPFYETIDDKLIAIHKRIEELQKAKDKIIEMRIAIHQRLENYLADNKNMKEVLGNEINSKKSLNQLLGFLLNSLERKEGVIAFKKAEFSNDEIQTFDGIMDFDRYLEKIIQQKPSEVIIPSANSNGDENKYKFDQDSKADGIMLLNNERIAKREEYSKYEQRFCLLTPKLLSSSQITLKISNLSNWIGVGLVKYDFIKKNNLQFLYKLNIFERGHYMISHKGYAWSDFDDKEHYKATSFEFETGDVLELNYDHGEKQISFENRSRAKNKSLKLYEIKEDAYAFAVALLGPGDAVEIVG